MIRPLLVVLAALFLSACALWEQPAAVSAKPALPPMPQGYSATWYGDFVLLAGSGVGALDEEAEAVRRILATVSGSVCIIRLDTDDVIELVPNKPLLLSMGTACTPPPPSPVSASPTSLHRD